MTRLLGTLLVAATWAFAFGSASAQSYPAKPIKFIVPFTAGSGTDIIARTVGEAMSKSLGQPVVIENRPGAGGTIAAAQVARGDADGYAVLVHSSGHALNPAIYTNLSYDTLRDLTGITPLASLPNVLVVNPAKGWKTLADLLAAARAKPGALNYASAGIGSATHMNAERFPPPSRPAWRIRTTASGSACSSRAPRRRPSSSACTTRRSRPWPARR